MSLLFVNGTLMRGLPLHGNLADAVFLGVVRTAPAYRIHSIGDIHPGMYRVDDGGFSVEGELYDVPEHTLQVVIQHEPPGLYVADVELADGRTVPGVLYPRGSAVGHPEISQHGGWRTYIHAREREGAPGERA